MNARELEFVDTNVLIYAHDRSAGTKHEQAKDLLQSLWDQRTGCLSTQTLQEFYVNVTRKLEQPLQPEVAAAIIADLSVWEIHRPAVNDVLAAIQLQTSHQFSFWDAMILTSAQQMGCKVLWSEDLSDGQTVFDVTVRNPFGPNL